MTSLFPQLEHQFEARAQELAEPARRYARPARLAALSLMFVGAGSGLAYASGLWQPQIGSEKDPRVAVTAAPASEVVKTIAALARPQTDADRAEASEFALTFPAKQQGVRTEYVRSLGETADGRSLVLVPVTDRVASAAGSDDELCLWTNDKASRSSGNRECTTLDGIRDGRLFFANGGLDPALEKARNAYDEAWTKEHPEGGVKYYPEELRATEERFSVTGLAPNGAAFAQLGPDGPRVPVTDNVFEGTTGSVPERVTFYSADGPAEPLNER